MPASLSVEDAAYLAGIIDGEGSVMVKRTTKIPKGGMTVNVCYTAMISVANTDQRLMRWCRARGGRVHEHKARGSWPGRRRAFQVFWSHRRAYWLAKQVLSFLVLKKRQASLIIRLAEIVEARKKLWRRIPLSKTELAVRSRIYAQVKRLNARSWSLYKEKL